MKSSRVRILVVDDREPWCRLVRSMLEKEPQLHIVGVASDGLEAIQKAQELQPDLILLDIGLPKLNGIEATKQIRQVSPDSKIIFLTQETSADIVEAALSTGALGYVAKTDARELPTAIGAVLRGEDFVSKSADRAITQQPCRHEVIFYSDDTGFLGGFTDFIAATLRSGNTAIVVATKSHREGLIQRLKRDSFDIEGAIQRRDYVALDALDTLRTIVVNGVPDRTRLFTAIGGLIDSAIESRKGEQHSVAACGESAPLLLAKGEPDAAIRLEQLWDELAKDRGIDVLCAYPMSSFPGGQEDPVFKMICAEHSAVYLR